MGIYQGNDYRNYLAHKDHKYIDRIKTSYGYRYIYEDDLKKNNGDRKENPFTKLSNKIGEKTFGKIFSAIDANNARKQKQETARRVQDFVDKAPERMKNVRKELNNNGDLSVQEWNAKNHTANNMKSHLDNLNQHEKDILKTQTFLSNVYDMKNRQHSDNKKRELEKVRMENNDTERQYLLSKRDADKRVNNYDSSVEEYNRLHAKNMAEKARQDHKKSSEEAARQATMEKATKTRRNNLLNTQGKGTNNYQGQKEANKNKVEKIDSNNRSMRRFNYGNGIGMQTGDNAKRKSDEYKNTQVDNRPIGTNAKGTKINSNKKDLIIVDKFRKKYPEYSYNQVYTAVSLFDSKDLDKVTANDIKKKIKSFN